MTASQEPQFFFPTSLGTSDAESISLLGQDLAQSLIGQVTFGELALWLLTLRRPTTQQTRVFEAVLVALADHGFTPTAIAARLTYLSAPDALQCAVATGILGGGSRYLGVTEDTARFLDEALAEAGSLPQNDLEWEDLAGRAITRRHAAGKRIPGLGHPVHKHTDPRTPVLVAIAREEGLYGPHLCLFEEIGRVHPHIIGKRLPLNGAGTCGAVLADLGLPAELCRMPALLARCAGILGQLAEEMRQPVAESIYEMVDSNARYVDPVPVYPGGAIE